jgi:hypothetical protein
MPSANLTLTRRRVHALGDDLLGLLSGKKTSLSTIQLERVFSRGLARRVGLYSWPSGTTPYDRLVVAIGRTDDAFLRNEALLRRHRTRIASLFPRTYAISLRAGRYAHAMEFIPGATLGELVARAKECAVTEAIHATLRSLNTLHSLASVSFSLPGSAALLRGCYWRLYHRPRVLRRLRDLSAALSPDMHGMLHSGFALLCRGVVVFMVPPLNQILRALDRRFLPVTPCLIHGDCKPENVIISENGPRLLDPHLSYGDPAIDYARLYYWLLTNSSLSMPALDGSIRGWGRAARTRSESPFYSPSHRTMRLAGIVTEALTKFEPSVSGTRFHIACGTTLIWQSGRLLEARGEQRSVSTRARPGARSSPRPSTKNVALELSGNDARHVNGALALGVTHLAVAAFGGRLDLAVPDIVTLSAYSTSTWEGTDERK